METEREREWERERQTDLWDGNGQRRTDVSTRKRTASDGGVKRARATSDGRDKQETDSVGQRCQTRNGQRRTDVSNGKRTTSDGRVNLERSKGGRTLDERTPNRGRNGQASNVRLPGTSRRRRDECRDKDEQTSTRRVPNREGQPDAGKPNAVTGERTERWASERRGGRSGPNAGRANAAEREVDRTLDEQTPRAVERTERWTSERRRGRSGPNAGRANAAEREVD